LIAPSLREAKLELFVMAGLVPAIHVFVGISN